MGKHLAFTHPFTLPYIYSVMYFIPSINKYSLRTCSEPAPVSQRGLSFLQGWECPLGAGEKETSTLQSGELHLEGREHGHREVVMTGFLEEVFLKLSAEGRVEQWGVFPRLASGEPALEAQIPGSLKRWTVEPFLDGHWSPVIHMSLPRSNPGGKEDYKGTWKLEWRVLDMFTLLTVVYIWQNLPIKLCILNRWVYYILSIPQKEKGKKSNSSVM